MEPEIYKDYDLVPLWVEVCNFLDVEVDSVKMPPLVFGSGVKAPIYESGAWNSILLPDRPCRLGILAHELAHAAMTQSPNYPDDRESQERNAQEVETYILAAGFDG